MEKSEGKHSSCVTGTCCRSSGAAGFEPGAAPSTAREKMGAPDGVSLVTSETPADDTLELSSGSASCNITSPVHSLFPIQGDSGLCVPHTDPYALPFGLMKECQI